MKLRLHAKLSLALLGLLLLLGAATLALTLSTSNLYSLEVQQKLNRELAAYIAEHSLRFEGDPPRAVGVEDLFHSLMVINPSIEVYLLDSTGEILTFSAPAERVVRRRVSLAPIERLLRGDSLPLLGDDPRRTTGGKIFSAAPLREAGTVRGYVYVILASEQHDSVATMVGGSRILRSFVGVGIASLALAAVGGALAFRRLTLPLADLSREIDAFETGELGPGEPVAVAPTGTGDELADLTRAFQRMAERIREQLDQLAEGDRQRRELVANVSHDLRTPLTQLQGYLETLTLDEGTSDQTRREYLRIALRQSERLGHLIGELFELAKLEAGELPLHRESFSVAELAQDVLQKYQLGASKRGVRMELEGPPDLAPVSADLGLIERVLDNLLDNALRYTPTGGRVAVAITPDRERVSIEVRDTGPGIAAADLPRIFDRFYRSRTAAADGSGGGGLGLAIAKRALELHTTELHCESEPGVGTTFRFDLPRFETLSP